MVVFSKCKTWWSVKKSKGKWYFSSSCTQYKKTNETICLTIYQAIDNSTKNDDNLLQIKKLQMPFVATCTNPGKRSILHISLWLSFRTCKWQTWLLPQLFIVIKLLPIFGMLTNIKLEFGGPTMHMQCLKVQRALPISMFFVLYLKIHALSFFFAKRAVTCVVCVDILEEFLMLRRGS
jgi:hypothetical protein